LDIETFALETLPGVLGIVLIAYVASQIFDLRTQFFQVARSWAFALSIAALAVLWVTEILEGSIGGAFEELNNAVGIWFVVFTIWLSTAMISLITIYPGHNQSSEF
jgi:uncharacterized membrane protein